MIHPGSPMIWSNSGASTPSTLLWNDYNFYPPANFPVPAVPIYHDPAPQPVVTSTPTPLTTVWTPLLAGNQKTTKASSPAFQKQTLSSLEKNKLKMLLALRKYRLKKLKLATTKQPTVPTVTREPFKYVQPSSTLRPPPKPVADHHRVLFGDRPPDYKISLGDRVFRENNEVFDNDWILQQRNQFLSRHQELSPQPTIQVSLVSDTRTNKQDQQKPLKHVYSWSDQSHPSLKVDDVVKSWRTNLYAATADSTSVDVTTLPSVTAATTIQPATSSTKSKRLRFRAPIDRVDLDFDYPNYDGVQTFVVELRD